MIGTVPEQAMAVIRALTLPDGRKLADTLPADPWLEERVLLPILSRDGDGLPLHRVAYIELARGHWKTGSVAAIALAEVLTEPDTLVVAVAADLDQARLIREAIEGQCRRNPALADALRRRQDDVRVEANGSWIRVMSSDAPSAFGIGVDCRRLIIICDEITQWLKADLYHAMVTTLPKVRDSRIICIGNAGVGPDTAWQWGVRESAREHGYFFSAEGTIASWITPDALAQVRAVVPPLIYERFYMNRWVEEVGTFVDMALWDACADPTLPPLAAGDRVVVGVDAAVSGDCFACVTVTRDPLRPAEAVAVREVRVWAPDGDVIDFDEPRAYLTGLASRCKVAQVCYDPYQLHDFMTRLQRDHRLWCEPFDQGPRRSVADTDLYRLIADGRVRHGGDPVLREHVSNAGLKVPPNEDTRARLVKRGRGKIDAIVATSMAASECLRLLL